MMRALSHPAPVAAVVSVACWDAWRWYLGRVASAPEEALALVLAIALVVATGLTQRSPVQREQSLPLLPVAVLLALYAASFSFAPAIVRAAIAATALLYSLYRGLSGRQPPLAFYGLVALSLPVVPSLQFVLGYPMRLISASMAVTLLQLQGLAVAREGTYLRWAGETIQFDAPCSGVNMLWAGVMLVLAACFVWRSGTLVCLLALGASLVLTIAANVLRATSLFYVEAGLLTGAAPWWHEAIGLIAFAISAAATLWVLACLKTWEAAT